MLEILKKRDTSISDCHGQAYGVPRNMSSKTKGDQPKANKAHRKSYYVKLEIFLACKNQLTVNSSIQLLLFAGFLKTTDQPTAYHRPPTNLPIDHLPLTNQPSTKCPDHRPTDHRPIRNMRTNFK